MQDYAIVVPSRKRTHNMPIIRSLLPTALVCVDERERDDYAPFVPGAQLLIHPPMDGLPRVMNWMMDAVKEPILIVIDDDFVGVRMLVGSRRYTMDADEILAILENAAQCCEDLGLTAFGFARCPKSYPSGVDPVGRFDVFESLSIKPHLEPFAVARPNRKLKGPLDGGADRLLGRLVPCPWFGPMGPIR